MTGLTWKGRACSCDDSIETPYSTIAASADSTDYGCMIPTGGAAVCPEPNPSGSTSMNWRPFMTYAVGRSFDQNYIGTDGSFNKYLGPSTRLSSPLSWSGGIAGDIAVTMGAHGKCDDTTPCHTGEGPCMVDTDCAGGLLCNLRFGATLNIPGYDPTRVEPGFKYCYDPQDNLIGCDPIAQFKNFDNNNYYYNYKYWDGQTFKEAAANHYVPMTKDGNNNLVIHKRDFPCPKGKYGVVWDSIPECALCPSGYYQDETGQSSCKSGCGGGQLGVIDVNNCVTCAQGKAPSSDFLSCVNCPGGKFEQNNACLSCPKNTYQDSGSTGQYGNNACKACPAGRSTENQIEFTGTCTGCAAGKFNANTESDCGNCPVGTYSTGSNTFYQSNHGAQDTSVTASECETYANSIGASWAGSAAHGNANPKGCFMQVGDTTTIYYSTSSSSPSVCGNIYNSICIKQQTDNKATSACSDCPAGSYNSQTGQPSCTNCGTGDYQDQTKQTSCKQCQQGKYNSQVGQPSCTNCGTGNYQDVLGQTNCKPCPAGKYQGSTGQASCTGNCPSSFAAGQGSPGAPIYAGISFSGALSPSSYHSGNKDLCGYCPNTGMSAPLAPPWNYFLEIENKYPTGSYYSDEYNCGDWGSAQECGLCCKNYNSAWTGFGWSPSCPQGHAGCLYCYCNKRGGIWAKSACQYNSDYGSSYHMWSVLLCPRPSKYHRSMFDDDHYTCRI